MALLANAARRTRSLLLGGLLVVLSLSLLISPAYAQDATPPPPPSIQDGATSAATAGITAGVAVAVIVLGGVLVYKLVKRFTT